MTLPRLAGPRVALVPTPHAVARAVLERGDVAAALTPLALRAGPGWPDGDTLDALRPLAEHGAEGDDGGWLVVVDGAVVGTCAWGGGPGGFGEVLLHYAVAKPSRRTGVGTEAVALLCAWAERQPEVRRLTAEVLVGNEASRRLVQRLGFTEESVDGAYVRCVRERRQRVRGRHVC